MKRLIAVALMGGAMAASGCGASSAEATDAGKAMAGVVNKSGALAALSTDMMTVAEKAQVRQVFSRMTNEAALAEYQVRSRQVSSPRDVLGHPDADYSSMTCGNLTITSTSSDTQISCSFGTCTNSAVSVTCTSSGTDTITCGSTTYSATNLSATISVDASGVTGGGSGGSLSIGMDFSANISGGTLSASNALSCQFSDTVTLGSSSAQSIGCSNFTCTYGGASISCSALQSAMQAGSSCS